jgi:protease I
MMGIKRSEVKKKVLMVIAQEKFRDEELATPRKVFLNNGFSVVIGSESLEEAVGKLGARVKPDVEISKVNFLDFDAVVVVGGPGSRDYLWDNNILHKGLVDLCAEGRVVSAICISPVVLARAGVLKGKSATVFPDNEAIAELKKSGVDYKNQDVVVENNVVTGRDPQAAERFAREIVNILNREEV